MIGFFLSLFLGDSGPIDAVCGYLLEGLSTAAHYC